METVILDVTQLAPQLKHPTIFQQFDALKEGEAFILHNDHDPKPLYYQLLGERGAIFSWDYLEQGPQWWKIKIAKKNLVGGEETIGEMAAKDLRKAEVFKRYGLEFCCGGQKPLAEACADAGVAVDAVEEALSQLPREAPAQPAHDYNKWELDFLSDYIVQVHHRYVREQTPLLRDLAAKIAGHHGPAHEELYAIQTHVEELLTEMQHHQIKEEKILFPFIKQMVQCKQQGVPFAHPPFGTIESPVEMMLEDHRHVADQIHAIARLSSDYTVPADGCESYRLFYHSLEAFDQDLHLHLHLENNILFPKAVRLEKQLHP